MAGRALDRDQAELGSNPSSPLPVTLDKSIPLLGLSLAKITTPRPLSLDASDPHRLGTQ